MALDQAGVTSGVRAVQDDLTISEPEAKRKEDEDQKLDETVDWVIKAFAAGDGSDIHATVSNGTVNLHGSVTEPWMANRMELLVAGVEGVIEVRNNLAVVPTRKVKDEHLAAEITEAFSRNAFIDETNIDIHVSDGVVTLSGTVGSWFESKTVQEVVWGARGASKINVQIEIEQDRKA
jgi:osmotically-inducible protein OsmY